MPSETGALSPFPAYARIPCRGDDVSGGPHSVWHGVERSRARAFQASAFPSEGSVFRRGCSVHFVPRWCFSECQNAVGIASPGIAL